MLLFTGQHELLFGGEFIVSCVEFLQRCHDGFLCRGVVCQSCHRSKDGDEDEGEDEDGVEDDSAMARQRAGARKAMKAEAEYESDVSAYNVAFWLFEGRRPCLHPKHRVFSVFFICSCDVSGLGSVFSTN